MDERDIEELIKLKEQAKRLAVQKLLQDIISKEKREPIKITKAHIQTVFITSNYGWSQSYDAITIRISLTNLMQINPEKYNLDVKERSIELDINNIKNNVIYKFKLNQLYHFVLPEKSRIKFKEDKIILTLIKQAQDIPWASLLMKSTHSVYHDLLRSQKNILPPATGPIDTSFFETTDKQEYQKQEKAHEKKDSE